MELEIYFLKNYDTITKILNKPAIGCWKTGVLKNSSGELIKFEKNKDIIIRNYEYDYSVFVTFGAALAVTPLKSNNKKSSLKEIVKKLILNNTI
jgi:hypothetical protein